MRLLTPIVPPASRAPDGRLSQPSPSLPCRWPMRLTAWGDEPAALAVVVQRVTPRKSHPLVERDEPRRVDGCLPCELLTQETRGALVPIGAVSLGTRVLLPEEDDYGVWGTFVVMERIWSEPPVRVSRVVPAPGTTE